MNAARRRLLGLGLMLIFLALLLWGTWPAGRGQREINISPLALQSPGLGSQEEPAEEARLRIEWPQHLRTGDNQIVQLAFELNPQNGSGATGAGQRDGFNRLVEAHLEMEGLLPDPDGDITAPIKPGGTSLLEWNLHPRQVGVYTGTLWVHIRFIPIYGDPGAKDISRVLTAQRLEFRSSSLLGLNGEQARLVGMSGVIAGVMIFLETFMEGFWKRAGPS